MPRLKYASVARVVVILGLFCLWLQIMLSASSGGLYRDADSHDTVVELQGLLLNEFRKKLNLTEGTFTNNTSNPSQNISLNTIQSKKVLPLKDTNTNNTKQNTSILVLPFSEDTSKMQNSAVVVLPYEEELMNSNDTSEQVLALVPPELHKYLTVHPRNGTGNSTEKIAPKNITEIRKAIQRYNDAQTIYNEDIFGPVTNDTVIIAIQVHTRLTYLRHLIVSLAQARDIDKTLLVFSHDYYDEQINHLVRTIDFTKVMQIFYPFSIQTHPNEFPGMDPNDCPRDAKFDQAVKLKCNNALYPDLHGHYREAKYTQTKHHWWWKANRIFNQLACTTGHTGMVLFLEEDHYVAEDFLHILSLLKATADKSCPFCEILSLGTYLKTYQYHVNSDKRKKHQNLNYIQQVRSVNEQRRKNEPQSWNFQLYPNLYTNTQKVEITPWHSSMHNMGFAFNRTVWDRLMELQEKFCEYDDYNWDYSLLYLSQNIPKRDKFKVIVCKGPRVFHIGECGFHHKKSNCNASTVISKVQKLLKSAKPYLFPSRVAATVTSGGAKHNKKLVKGNGGWGDIRDRELCTNMTLVGRQPRKNIYYV